MKGLLAINLLVLSSVMGCLPATMGSTTLTQPPAATPTAFTTTRADAEKVRAATHARVDAVERLRGNLPARRPIKTAWLSPVGACIDDLSSGFERDAWVIEFEFNCHLSNGRPLHIFADFRDRTGQIVWRGNFLASHYVVLSPAPGGDLRQLSAGRPGLAVCGVGRGCGPFGRSVGTAFHFDRHPEVIPHVVSASVLITPSTSPPLDPIPLVP